MNDQGTAGVPLWGQWLSGRQYALGILGVLGMRGGTAAGFTDGAARTE